MTLPVSGQISMQQIDAELGLGKNLGAYRGVTFYKADGTPVVIPNTNVGMANFYGLGIAFSLNITFGAYGRDVNMRDHLIAAGWNGVTPLVSTITVAALIGCSSTAGHAFRTGTPYPAGSRLKLVLNGAGRIIGAGGNGGTGAYDDGRFGEAGTKGGRGLLVEFPLTIANYGIIASGGGGGGGGGGFANGNINSYQAGGGGGGGGDLPGQGASPVYYPDAGDGGNPGTTYAGGAGGQNFHDGRPGGNGGNPGSPGATGGAGGWPGGATDYAVYGNGNVTWEVYGDVRGPIV